MNKKSVMLIKKKETNTSTSIKMKNTSKISMQNMCGREDDQKREQRDAENKERRRLTWMSSLSPKSNMLILLLKPNSKIQSQRCEEYKLTVAKRNEKANSLINALMVQKSSAIWKSIASTKGKIFHSRI